MKVYLAGKITGDPDYLHKFQHAALYLRKEGHTVMSPACLPFGFNHDQYMHICKAMIDIVEAAYFLPDWTQSDGAKIENDYCKEIKKERRYLFATNLEVCDERNYQNCGI